MRRASIVRFAMISLVLGAGVFLYIAALQTSETVRFEFGSMDWDFLGNPEAFEKRNRMDGPIRYPDGSVEVIQFYGRIALDNAEIRLPYHARRSPLRLRIRCHRFGLGGSVELTVNGVLGVESLLLLEAKLEELRSGRKFGCAEKIQLE